MPVGKSGKRENNTDGYCANPVGRPENNIIFYTVDEEKYSDKF